MQSINNLEPVYERLNKEILSGVQHGFFEFLVCGEIKNGKQNITLKAGKSYRYVIPLDNKK